MSNVYELPDRARTFDEASDWIARLDSGLTDDEEEALRRWLAASEQNSEVLFEMAALWDRMGVLSRLSDICPHPVKQSSKIPWFTLAAALLLAVLAGLWYDYDIATRESSDDRKPAPVNSSLDVYETAIGEQSTINLPDGTQLVLNTNSLVQAKYTDKHRLLKLHRGEIHVSVAPDRLRPLSVIAGNNIVQAIGTAFNIEINHNDEIELVVIEGTVRVGVYEIVPHGNGHGVPEILSSSSVAVSAGEETILGAPQDELETIETDEIAVKLSWREGNLVFRGESLEEAVTEIGRYTAVEFVILDEASKRVRVAGLFKAGDVNGLLAVLEKNFNVTSQRIGDNKVVLKGR